MITIIEQPAIIHFLRTTIYDPFAEGAERVNRAIQGVNLHHILHPEIGLSERIWTMFVGISLMIPLINSVIWIFMQTFGKPEHLRDPDLLEPLRESFQMEIPQMIEKL